MTSKEANSLKVGDVVKRRSGNIVFIIDEENKKNVTRMPLLYNKIS